VHQAVPPAVLPSGVPESMLLDGDFVEPQAAKTQAAAQIATTLLDLMGCKDSPQVRLEEHLPKISQLIPPSLCSIHIKLLRVPEFSVRIMTIVHA
jgi:hypothetical protein